MVSTFSISIKDPFEKSKSVIVLPEKSKAESTQSLELN